MPVNEKISPTDPRPVTLSREESFEFGPLHNSQGGALEVRTGYILLHVVLFALIWLRDRRGVACSVFRGGVLRGRPPFQHLGIEPLQA